MGILYYLEYSKLKKNQQLNVIEKGSKERLWYHCYGYLGKQSLKKLTGKGLYTVLIMMYLKRLVSVKHVLVEIITEVRFIALGYMIKRIT